MWQTLERKAKFIAAVMRGRLDVRDIADIADIADIGDTALSYAEVKALATGNPLLMEQAKAASALAVLQRAERAHNRNQSHLHHTIRDLTARAESLRAEATDAERAMEVRQDTAGDKFAMTVDGVAFDRRADAAPALSESIRLMIRKARELYTGASMGGTVGELAGFTVME